MGCRGNREVSPPLYTLYYTLAQRVWINTLPVVEMVSITLLSSISAAVGEYIYIHTSRQAAPYLTPPYKDPGGGEDPPGSEPQLPPTLPSLQLPSTQLPRTTCTQMLFLGIVIFIATAAPVYILNQTLDIWFWFYRFNDSLDAFTACEPEVIAPWCRLFTINCKLLLSQQNIHSRPGIILRREESNHTGGRKHYSHLHHALLPPFFQTPLISPSLPPPG